MDPSNTKSAPSRLQKTCLSGRATTSPNSSTAGPATGLQSSKRYRLPRPISRLPRPVTDAISRRTDKIHQVYNMLAMLLKDIDQHIDQPRHLLTELKQRIHSLETERPRDGNSDPVEESVEVKVLRETAVARTVENEILKASLACLALDNVEIATNVECVTELEKKLATQATYISTLEKELDTKTERVTKLERELAATQLELNRTVAPAELQAKERLGQEIKSVLELRMLLIKSHSFLFKMISTNTLDIVRLKDKVHSLSKGEDQNVDSIKDIKESIVRYRKQAILIYTGIDDMSSFEKRLKEQSKKLKGLAVHQLKEKPWLKGWIDDTSDSEKRMKKFLVFNRLQFSDYLRTEVDLSVGAICAIESKFDEYRPKPGCMRIQETKKKQVNYKLKKCHLNPANPKSDKHEKLKLLRPECSRSTLAESILQTEQIERFRPSAVKIGDTALEASKWNILRRANVLDESGCTLS
ncbi:hypothetical protein BC936DRAFT_141555 [Jimgerdemannia flammicorona]|uniref:Uncharacterized protein n=1 Tax=Jimgerdemannia flammicorona TaxID=994334 RepID=A0A433A220_9FUNG|nr:hypothetical protein BC936DRAFT_141555 [Jimgerdemannia flammicorona]